MKVYFKINAVLIGWLGYEGVKAALPQLVPTMDMQGAEAVKFVGELTLSIFGKRIIIGSATKLLLPRLIFCINGWEYGEKFENEQAGN